ncbi:archease [Methylophaga sp. OBS4]|uniref:archease n=1 Tax=Methylophaga sp. OBS4 TaxID=2991935 RepID=UPI0022536AD3|nr:archease [Methylophaga sp. OBS4]MCX4187280.1 archease [Methylophaga sp. OBS4]
MAIHKLTIPYWEHFRHEADIGVRGVAANKAEAFAQVAMAMTAVITDLDSVLPQNVVEIDCETPDEELLLVEWLNTLIYEMATRRMLFSRFDVVLKDGQLHARAYGETLEVSRHHPAVEVKGATYTELALYQLADNNWVAQCVVDV